MITFIKKPIKNTPHFMFKCLSITEDVVTSKCVYTCICNAMYICFLKWDFIDFIMIGLIITYTIAY